jgi:hypothetical protein
LNSRFAVFALVALEVALDDVGDEQLAGGGVVLRVPEDLAEFLPGEVVVGGVLVALEQGDAAAADVGTVGVFVRGVPETCGARHE